MFSLRDCPLEALPLHYFNYSSTAENCLMAPSFYPPGRNTHSIETYAAHTHQLLENIKNQISIFETKEHGGPQKITQNIIYMTKVYYSSLFEPYFVFFVVGPPS